MAIETGGLSFQFRPEALGGVGARASGAAPNMGISGGQSAAGIQMFADTAALGNAQLPEFIEKMFAPKMEAAKQQKFWQGFVAARSGKTQQEIADEVPWYAGIFGPTDYELGSQTYAAQKAAADMEAQFIERLPQLRELPPEQLGVELNELAKGLLTGEVYSDALIQKMLMERAGPMVAAHAKARYEWQQSELSRTRHESWMAAGQAFQVGYVNDARLGKEHPGQAPTPEQLRERALLLVQNFQMGEYEDPFAWQRDFGTFIKSAADGGQWATLNALMETGALKALSPEQQQAASTYIEAARNRYKANMAANPQLFGPIMALRVKASAGAVSADETVAAMQEVDALYSALTGDTKGFFDLNDYVATPGSAAAAMYNAYEAAFRRSQAAKESAADDAAKAQAQAEMDARAALMVNTGSAGDLAALPGVTKEYVDSAFMAQLNAGVAPGSAWRPANLGSVAVSNMSSAVAGKRPYYSTGLAEMLRAQVRSSAGENWTQGFEVAYQNWLSMVNYQPELEGGGKDTTSGLAAAMQYFGEHHEAMLNYHQLRTAGDNPEFAYRQAFGQRVTWRFDSIPGEVREDAMKELTAVVQEQNPPWYSSAADLGASAESVVLQAMLPHFARMRSSSGGVINTAEAARQALQLARMNGLEISGRYAWQNQRGQQSLSEYTGIAADVFEEHFESLVTGRFRAQGISINDDTSVLMIRVPDGPEGPRMMAAAYHDGTQRLITLTAEDIKKVRDRAAERQRTRQESTTEERMNAVFGNPGGMPIIR